MKKEKIIVILAFLLIIFTFLGFPTGIKQIFYVVISIIIIILSFQIQNRKIPISNYNSPKILDEEISIDMDIVSPLTQDNLNEEIKTSDENVTVA